MRRCDAMQRMVRGMVYRRIYVLCVYINMMIRNEALKATSLYEVYLVHTLPLLYAYITLLYRRILDTHMQTLSLFPSLSTCTNQLSYKYTLLCFYCPSGGGGGGGGGGDGDDNYIYSRVTEYSRVI